MKKAIIAVVLCVFCVTAVAYASEKEARTQMKKALIQENDKIDKAIKQREGEIVSLRQKGLQNLGALDAIEKLEKAAVSGDNTTQAPVQQ